MSEFSFQGLKKRWRILDPPDNSALLSLSDYPRLMATLLHQRGIQTPREVQAFLNPNVPDLLDTQGLPEIDEAVKRLEVARDGKEITAVFGDFDADGVTGTALMVKAFQRYGLNAVAYIPDRVKEGHGLNTDAIQYLRRQGVSLIVTVDCGVTDVEPISLAHDLGIDVIVTDHHTVTGPRSKAVAIINPQAPKSTYPFHHLTGVGMALKLSQALLELESPEDWSKGLLELAAIGTITDMAPLSDENRSIVRGGLADLQTTSNLGLRALLNLARIDPAHVTAETIGFALGPRLNAAGRMNHAMVAYELLMTQDPNAAETMASDIEDNNNRRRELTAETLQHCRQEILEKDEVGPLIMLGSAEFNPGIVGLVAGNLSEEFGVPAVVYALKEGIAKGSCRTKTNFHWSGALVSCDDLLVQHGGHAQAAGFSCSEIALPELEARLQAIATETSTPISTDGIINVELELADIFGPMIPAIQSMGPFGVGNPTPVFFTRRAHVENAQTMGHDGRHFRLRLTSADDTWDAVAFNQTWHAGTEHVDIVYSVGIDHWRGKERLRLTIHDYTPAS